MLVLSNVGGLPGKAQQFQLPGLKVDDRLADMKLGLIEPLREYAGVLSPRIGV